MMLSKLIVLICFSLLSATANAAACERVRGRYCV